VALADSTTQLTSWKRLDGIDLLRGLAIFFVLVEHVNIRLSIAKVSYIEFLPAQLAHFLIGNGELGVQMFFAVSGFLIFSISLRRWSPLSEIRMGDFYTPFLGSEPACSSLPPRRHSGKPRGFSRRC
jgi:peptidoglycan/LPS O-acetylase OafA/YrhL